MATNDAIRDAWLEVEHISGIAETLQRTRDRFRNVKNEEPIERVDAFRAAVDATRNDHGKTIERINRWWRPFDRAFDKLVSVCCPSSKARSVNATTIGRPSTSKSLS